MFDQELRNKDIISTGKLKEISKVYADISNSSKKWEKYISSLERNDENLCIKNILSSNEKYCLSMSRIVDDYISVVASVCRSIWELNVQIRDVTDEGNQGEGRRRWFSEAVTGHIELLESRIRGASPGSDPVALAELGLEVSRLKDLQIRRNLKTEKSASFSNLSKSAQLEDEYNFHYKILSKLAHPTSYLVNFDNSDSVYNRNELFIVSQKSAWDTVAR